MELKFRVASLADADDVFTLFQDAVLNLREHRIDQWDEIYPSGQILSEDIADGQMYVMTLNGKLAAAVVLNEDQPEEYDSVNWLDKYGRYAVVHRLCVRPDFQGMGIGRQMMEAVEKHLSAAGFTSLRLDAFKQNKAAVHLYEKMGYRPRGSAQFRKGEFILLEKQLPRNK